MAVAQVFDVRHEVRESRFRDEVEPLALRRLVGRLGAAAEEGDLRPCVHRRGPCRRLPRPPGPPRLRRSTAAARLAGLQIAVVDRRVLVDLLVENERSEPVGPPPVARLVRRSMSRTSGLALISRTMASRSASVACDVGIARIAQRADGRVPAARRPVDAEPRRHVAGERLDPFVRRVAVRVEVDVRQPVAPHPRRARAIPAAADPAADLRPRRPGRARCSGRRAACESASASAGRTPSARRRGSRPDGG